MEKTPSSCLVWLPADHRGRDGADGALPYLMLGEKYAAACKFGAHAQPVVFPLVQAQQIPALLDLVDGVMLTGSPSNVHPSHFDEAVLDTSLPLDTERDTLVLPLVQACIAQGVPLLGICRGFQEMNVALGGSLHQRVHGVDGLMDHTEPEDDPIDAQYAPRHPVRFAADSVFAQWAGGTTAMVNSLHGQGINRLSPGLQPLGWAEDGLVEAFGVAGAPAFAYAVQWHPEWKFRENPFYAAILNAFGEACQARRDQRFTTEPR